MSGPRRRKFVGSTISRAARHGGRGRQRSRWALLIALVAGHAVEAVAVDGAHGDRLEAAIALDDHLHLLLDAALPELSVERFLTVPLLAIEPYDHVARAKAGGARGPDGRHSGD